MSPLISGPGVFNATVSRSACLKADRKSLLFADHAEHGPEKVGREEKAAGPMKSAGTLERNVLLRARQPGLG